MNGFLLINEINERKENGGEEKEINIKLSPLLVRRKVSLICIGS